VSFPAIPALVGLSIVTVQLMGSDERNATASALTEAAREIIALADSEQRDLSEFEAGRVDAFLDVAEVMRAVERLLAA
jgi:hypothetical protein